MFGNNPLDMARYRCFSGVRLPDQGLQRKRMVASLRNYQFYLLLNGLDPDGCLVADRLKVGAKTLDNTGAD